MPLANIISVGNICCRGTCGWTAPELFGQNLSVGQQDSTSITGAADIYATGWVFFEVLCGVGPLMFAEGTTDHDYAHSTLS